MPKRSIPPAADKNQFVVSWPVRPWTTQDEIEFLKKLGTGEHQQGNNKSPVFRRARRELLRRYRRSMALRVDWGRIDPVVVRAYLDLELG